VNKQLHPSAILWESTPMGYRRWI